MEIDEKGDVKIEFVGFPGNSCSEERERIREILLGLGVELDPEEIQRKSSEQIARELKGSDLRGGIRHG